MSILVLNENRPPISVEQIQKFDSSDILWMSDTFLNEELIHILSTRGNPGYIASELLASYLSNDIRIYCLPLAAPNLLQNLLPSLIIPSPNEVSTDCCFNFIINKPSVNRFLLLKLVEWFKLIGHSRYTWSGAGHTVNANSILKEIDQLDGANQQYNLFRKFVISTVKIDPHWVDVVGLPDKRTGKKEQNFITSSSKINDPWNSGLKDVIFHSGVSLISESINFQPGAVFTEKTHYSVLGLTFPIWVGGKGQAYAWKNIGFDTFDDVVDHSYQWHGTLFQRCYHAIADNLHLLNNIEYVKGLRNQHMERLLHNRELLLSDCLRDYCLKELGKLPDILKKIWIPFVKEKWEISSWL